jgi:hypothetical protein
VASDRATEERARGSSRVVEVTVAVHAVQASWRIDLLHATKKDANFSECELAITGGKGCTEKNGVRTDTAVLRCCHVCSVCVGASSLTPTIVMLVVALR